MKTIMVNSLESLKHLKGFNQVDKIMEIPSGLTPYTDAYRLSVIATSLFSNCIKFQDETKTKSYLKFTVTIDKMITLIISDNGIGIRPQSLEHVYEMFYRGTVKSDGAGLGLYIVREMIKKLEGSIQIQSELGLFTSVTVILPNLKDLGNTV